MRIEKIKQILLTYSEIFTSPEIKSFLDLYKYFSPKYLSVSIPINKCSKISIPEFLKQNKINFSHNKHCELNKFNSYNISYFNYRVDMPDHYIHENKTGIDICFKLTDEVLNYFVLKHHKESMREALIISNNGINIQDLPYFFQNIIHRFLPTPKKFKNGDYVNYQWNMFPDIDDYLKSKNIEIGANLKILVWW